MKVRCLFCLFDWVPFLRYFFNISYSHSHYKEKCIRNCSQSYSSKSKWKSILPLGDNFSTDVSSLLLLSHSFSLVLVYTWPSFFLIKTFLMYSVYSLRKDWTGIFRSQCVRVRTSSRFELSNNRDLPLSQRSQPSILYVSLQLVILLLKTPYLHHSKQQRQYRLYWYSI